jgi:hypothetical protein
MRGEVTAGQMGRVTRVCGQAVQGVRPAPGPAAAPVAGRLAAPGPPRPVRRRPGRRRAGPGAGPGRLHRQARLPALRSEADAASVDLRLHHRGALLAGDRAKVRRRHRVPVPGRRQGPGLPLDLAVPPPPPGRPRRPFHPVAAPRAEARHGQDGPPRPGRHQARSERLQAQGDELRPPGRQGGADRGRDRRSGGPGRRPARRRRGHRHRRGPDVGIDGKDTDLPAELDRREKRLARLQAARAQIEAEAADKARRHAEDKERCRQERVGTSDEQAVTDADSRLPRRPVPSPRRRPTSPTPTRGS